MFKDFSSVARVALLAVFLTAGCRSLPPLPRADLAAPGWTVFQGQALWRSEHEAPEIAGELVVAFHNDGRTLVQFSKTPFPLVIAQTTANAWQIEAPVENRRFARNGAPPRRVLWFHLPELLQSSAGEKPPEPWSWRKNGDELRVENRSTGEHLEGFLEPAAKAPRGSQ
ncbi:MAG TPA: hypothetical protein VEH04_12195 [Verrucomicrobiae bacterium]|nr:hypothetical protein [Verrucomicrobiae bacterium]